MEPISVTPEKQPNGTWRFRVEVADGRAKHVAVVSARAMTHAPTFRREFLEQVGRNYREPQTIISDGITSDELLRLRERFPSHRIIAGEDYEPLVDRLQRLLDAYHENQRMGSLSLSEMLRLPQGTTAE